MSTRKTAKDYKKELKDLVYKFNFLESRVKDRLKKMIEKNPDLIVFSGGVTLKNSYLGSKGFVDKLTTLNVIEYIEHIENKLKEKEPYKQSEINFK